VFVFTHEPPEQEALAAIEAAGRTFKPDTDGESLTLHHAAQVGVHGKEQTG